MSTQKVWLHRDGALEVMAGVVQVSLLLDYDAQRQQLVAFKQQLARKGRTNAVVRALVAPLSLGDARWRPEEGGWSVLEIVNHLADEETQDFRQRLIDNC